MNNDFNIPHFMKKETNYEKRPRFSLGFKILAFLFLGGVIVALAFSFRKTPVIVFSKVSVKFVGNNGEGSLEVVPKDELDALAQDLSLMEFNVENNGHLSNGDTVVVKVVGSKENKAILKSHRVKLTRKEERMKVSGLNLLKELNVFEFYTLNVDGYDGTGTLQFVLDPEKTPVEFLESLALIEFTFDKTKDLKNDDRVVVSFEMSETLKENFKAMGYTLKPLSKVFTVGGLNNVAMDITALPNLNELRAEALEKITQDLLKREPSARNIREAYACYTSKPTHTANFEDEYGVYEGGTLMFIYTYDKRSFLLTRSYADEIGFTNLQIKNGSIDKETKRLINPPQEGQDLAFVLRQLKQNNFICDPN